MNNIDTITKIHARATCLCTRKMLEKALDKMAVEITEKLQHTNPLLLCVMIGGVIPTGHLATRLNFPLQIDYLHVTRYRGTNRGGDLHWLVEPRQNLRDRTILIIEDILDEGRTLSSIIDYCQQQAAKAVYTAVVVDKCRPRGVNALAKANFTGIETDDHYLYGFGLDYHEYLRNIFGIYAVALEDN